MYEKPLIGWKNGMDNIHAPQELGYDSARAATNVDFLDSGKVRSRVGKSLITAMIGAHSLWSDEKIGKAFYVRGTTMYSVDNKLAATAIVTGLMYGKKVSYVSVNDEVFWSNGVTTGRIRGLINTPWGVEQPTKPPTLAVTTGSVYPGTYQIAYTFVNTYGEEGGSTTPVSITLATLSGITITISPPVDSGVTAARIYMTSSNGTILGHVATLPVGTTTKTINTVTPTGTPLATLVMDVVPPGSLLAHRHGTIFSAVGNMVVHTHTLRYGLYDPDKHFYLFPRNVDILMATPAGLFVCADKTYFIENPGSPDAVQHVKLPHGGTQGTGVYFPNNTEAAWFSDRGQVITQGGDVLVATEKHLAPRPAAAGNAFFIEKEGVRQIVTLVDQPGSNSLAYI